MDKNFTNNFRYGINSHISPIVERFYNANYEILRTPDFCEESRLLKPVHGMNIIGSANHKVCRFCGREEPEVSFNKIAHAFPECIGNHTLATNFECDECNDFFGKTIENDYGRFFEMYHSLMHIRSKKGFTKSKFKVSCDRRNDDCAEQCISLTYKDGVPIIKCCEWVSEEYLKRDDRSLIISKPIGKCCPIGVYKTFVKMALTVMPIEEIDLFREAIAWLRKPEHDNFYDNNERLLLRYQMIPGFGVTKYPCYVLYRRKRTVWDKPYMLFNLTYGCLSLMIEVPKDRKERHNEIFKNIPFAPIPFYVSNEGIWDLTELDIPMRTCHSIVLRFDDIKPIDVKELNFL